MNKKANEPKASIVIPTWTGEISRLLQSIERQTMKDYEL